MSRFRTLVRRFLRSAFDPIEDVFRDQARVQRALDDFHERMAVHDKAVEAAEAKRQAEMTAWALAHNQRLIDREWSVAGLECPWKDDQGRAKFSLSLVMLLGWSIEIDGQGRAILIKPVPPENPGKRETRINEMGS